MRASLIYSKGIIDRAGMILSGQPGGNLKYDESIKILQNFRAIHIHPMFVFRVLLQRKTKLMKNNTLISQRMKRAPSIINKLKIQKKMALSQMQDIGGLRAVLNSLEDVYFLRDLISKSEKQIAFKSTLITEKDYIKNPKESGYRSIHLVYKYEKNVPIKNQCRIEIQLRTKIHHAWATAVEVVGTYLRQPLKQSFGDEELLILFKEISKVFILLEEHKVDIALFKSTSEMIYELKLRDKLKGFTVATQISLREAKNSDGKYFLISLDFKNKVLSWNQFPESRLDQANIAYSELEKKYLNNSSVEVVLVSVDDIANLNKLYPNYFLDTDEFVKLLNKVDEEIIKYETK